MACGAPVDAPPESPAAVASSAAADLARCAVWVGPERPVRFAVAATADPMATRRVAAGSVAAKLVHEGLSDEDRAAGCPADAGLVELTQVRLPVVRLPLRTRRPQIAPLIDHRPADASRRERALHEARSRAICCGEMVSATAAKRPPGPPRSENPVAARVSSRVAGRRRRRTARCARPGHPGLRRA